MQESKNKLLIIVFSLLLIASMAASMVLIPSANAHTPSWQITTYAYINVQPDPIGVGQPMTVYMWLYNTFDSELISNTYRFHNYQLTITAPDGKVTTQTWPYISDTTSSQYTTFTPDQAGTYIFNFTFPGQAINTYDHNPASAYVNDSYLPSSASATLTVQQNQIPAAISSYPLPTNYWTRPIYGENSYWYTISSNWLGTGSPQIANGNFGKGAYIPDAIGPLTSHIMWTKELQGGGVVGGNSSGTVGAGYFEGSAYNTRFSNPIIVDGHLYYAGPVSFTGSNVGAVNCVDLQTGQILWSRTDVPSLSFAYIYNLWDPNQHGVFPPILFTASFARAFDAYTGDPLFNVTNVPTGKSVMGPNGEQLRYVMMNSGTASKPNWYLTQWNSSKIWQYNGLSPALANATTIGTAYGDPESATGGTPPAIAVPPAGTSVAASGGINFNAIPWSVVTANCTNPASLYYNYDWNVTLPWANSLNMTTFNVLAAYYNDMLLCWNSSNMITLPGSSAKGSMSVPYTYFAVNLNANKGAIGSILWTTTVQPPSGNLTVVPNAIDPITRVFTEEYRETVQWVGYNLDTGQKLWGPSASQTSSTPLDYYGNQFSGHMLGEAAYGNLYSIGFAGVMYCYNIITGQLKWTYGNGVSGNSTNGGLNSFYGHYPTFVTAVANGVIYMETTEHTITDPIYKGALARAINATDGTEIWTLSDYNGGGSTMSAYALADGYSVFFNGYDDQIYSVGRGASATTVTAPDAGVSLGQPVVIKGTVMDISAGTTQTQQAADFPHGVPVASDASMKDWMGYVYQQKPLPTNFTGVPVTLSVLDSNGNYRNIGTVTTNTYGKYSLTWTPDITGNFTVYASFAGTNGYWPSSDTTNFAVAQAATTTTPTPQPVASQEPLGMYIALAAVAMIIAVAIGFAVTILTLRKRP